VENAISGERRHSWIDIDPVAWRTERIMHHEAVLRYFKNRPEKLFVMDICGGDDWTDLCDFLNCPPPNVPFPHVNPIASRDTVAALSLGPLKIRKCSSRPLQHDDYPWIKKPSERSPTPQEETLRAARLGRVGTFALFCDHIEQLNNERWVKLDDTFDTNLAVFRPENVSLLGGGGLRFTVKAEPCQDRSYTAGAISLRGDRSSHFIYGRFEAEIKPARADGILTGMFLHRRDPWQEIDLEFLGAEPDHMLANIYYNPGEEGDHYNYGMRGTPVLISLGFDASKAFHHYAIEWDPTGVRWFVDGELVFARGEAPTPVPYLPMRFYLNTWPIDAEELAGSLNPAQLPATTDIRSVAVSSWIPSLRSVVFSRGHGASWIRKGKKL